MSNVLRLAGQAVVYGLVAITLGYLSDSPGYTHVEDDSAEIVISFSHGGARIAPCRKLTDAEIAEIAPNMRRKNAEVCPRERIPVVVELDIDGTRVLEDSLTPGGLSRDGVSQIYRRFATATGRHHLKGRLRDSPRTSGFDYSFEAEIDLSSRQRYVIDFRDEFGGFLYGDTMPQNGVTQ
jgi:hypothetical protein